MSKSIAIVCGIQIGIAITDIILAIKWFSKGSIITGIVFILLAMVLILQIVARFKKRKPRCTVEIRRVTQDEIVDFIEELSKQVEGELIMTKREAQELKGRLEELEKENADLQKQNEELKKMIKEYSDDKLHMS